MKRPNAGQKRRFFGLEAGLGATDSAASTLPALGLEAGWALEVGLAAGWRRSITLLLRLSREIRAGGLVDAELALDVLATASTLRALRIGFEVSFGSIVPTL